MDNAVSNTPFAAKWSKSSKILHPIRLGATAPSAIFRFVLPARGRDANVVVLLLKSDTSILAKVIALRSDEGTAPSLKPRYRLRHGRCH